MTDITTNETMRDFLRLADGFHDALIRECRLVARGFVDPEYRMHGDTEPFDALVFLQTQASDLPGIEMEFGGVRTFCVGHPFDLLPSGSIENGEVRFSFSAVSGKEPQVVAAAMRYRFLGVECLGEGHVLTRNRASA